MDRNELVTSYDIMDHVLRLICPMYIVSATNITEHVFTDLEQLAKAGGSGNHTLEASPK